MFRSFPLGLTALLLATTAAVQPLRAQEGEEMSLAPITVTGSSYDTEGSDSYTTEQVSVGEKQALTQREVPQSTSVVTRKQIEDGNYTALETALDDVPGLIILTNDIGRSSIYSRGFEFDYLYFDGLPAPVASIYGTQPDLSIVDHVEVLKGPAGLFQGTGEPAGAINMRLKQANSRTTTGYVKTEMDSWGHVRGEADVSGKLNESGTLRGRAVLTYGDGGTFIHGQTNGVQVGYATLAWDIAPDWRATFSATHTQRDLDPYNGLPSYADGSLIYTDAGATTAADWNRFRNEVTDYTAAAEHRFAGGGTLKFSARKSVQIADFLYAYSGSTAAADNTISRLAYLGRKFHQSADALDVHLDLPFTIGGMQANAILGADWQHTRATTKTARGAIAGSFDLDDWDTGDVAEPVPAYTSQTRTVTDTQGLYAQFRLKPVERMAVIGGLRATWYDQKTTDLLTGAISRSKANGHLTPFAGLTYDLTPETTAYLSYSSIFQPQTYTDRAGRLLDPVTGRQAEVGLKGRYFGGLDASAALFDLRETNRPVAQDGGAYYTADEEVAVQGAELTLSGEPLPNLHLSGGYTYSYSHYTGGDSDGEVFSTVTPRHQLKLTAVYRLTRGPLEGWSFGGSFRAYSNFSSNGVSAPGYGVVDVMAEKSFRGIDLQFGISNLFDKAYYSRVGSATVFNFRGAPRTFTLAATKRF